MFSNNTMQGNSDEFRSRSNLSQHLGYVSTKHNLKGGIAALDQVGEDVIKRLENRLDNIERQLEQIAKLSEKEFSRIYDLQQNQLSKLLDKVLEG